VSMAHGYYLATGRPQVAMVHVNVGTANGLGAIIGAHRARVPIFFSAGRHLSRKREALPPEPITSTGGRNLLTRRPWCGST
jgi:thiamine pyrophosphate-dependent acetolactate synthase large subunit-like protein